MWNIRQKFAAPLIDQTLAQYGFAVGSTGGVARVEKYGCASEFRRMQDGRYAMTISPSVLINGQFTRLWDAGYQKFLLFDDGRRMPALADQLMNLRKFNEELRDAIGVPTYYNEALGSTARVTAYDRVKGRKGDDPATDIPERVLKPRNVPAER